MCLAIPAQITEMKDNRLATVDILGVTRDVALDLTPQAVVGDFVLVHAGFAIEIVDPDYAQETIDLIKEFPELAGEEMPSDSPLAPANRRATAAAAEAAAAEQAAAKPAVEAAEAAETAEAAL